MHTSAAELGKKFFETYWRSDFGRILDIGSYDVNGTLREFQPPGSEYVGIDLQHGPGVDLVLQDAYSYPFPEGHFDIIVSTSCFEHDPMFWLTFIECVRVLSPQGFLYINAPSSGVHHGYPYDCWRFCADAALGLQKWAQRVGRPVRLLESFIAVEGPMSADFWNDYVAVFGKDQASRPGTCLSDRCSSASRITKPK
ncbi:MAG: class I SAM-dependent methyltransferase [Acidisphaera sp.]|nr:class I SAM-dependent methyltransferase [Acidisphaera sp.]